MADTCLDIENAAGVGHNTELGLNVKYDNVFGAEDKIRAKVNAFNNDVTNYVDCRRCSRQ